MFAKDSGVGQRADPLRRALRDRLRDRVLGGVLDGAGAGAAARPRSMPSAAITSSRVILPVVTVPVLSSTIGVDPAGGLQHLRALDQDAELRAAAGADQQRGRGGEAQGARAGDDQHRDGGGERGRGREPGAEPDREGGDGDARSRSARRPRRPGRRAAAPRPCRTGRPRPAWPSARAGCREPTRVARTTSRPPALTVAPTTGSPAPTSTGTDSPVSMEASTAEVPSTTTPSVAIFSPGRTTNSSPTARSSIGMRVSAPSRQHRDVLRAELEQCPQGRAGLPLGPLLEVAAGEDEHGDAGGDLEVDVRRRRRSGCDRQLEGVGHARLPGGAEEQRVQRPQRRRRWCRPRPGCPSSRRRGAGWSARPCGTATPPTRPPVRRGRGTPTASR